ncbi:MAG: hypothetical protein HFE86_05140 [Clostridiales bacterium]|nr:hypothetical protein [Clostridiales bacterium]
MKAMIKKAPVLLLAILLAMTSASYAAPAAEVEAHMSSSTESSETEVPMDSAAVEPAAETETSVTSVAAESAIEAQVSMAAMESAAEAETFESSVVAEPVAETDHSGDSPAESESW